MTKDTRFKPGQSGNPAGRPPGAKDRRTAFRELLDSKAEDLINRTVEKALDGDATCLRLCLERLVSPYRATGAPVVTEELSGTLTEQGQKIIREMGQGNIPPDEAASMLSALASQARIAEVDDLTKRIEILEKANVNKAPR